jgi:hypothetical protein
MNYFAQGIQQGAEIGARSYLEKKKRDQDAALNKARLEFEANQLKEQFKGQGDLQNTRLLADAENLRKQREFTGGENALNRTYGTSERKATQGFQGGQNDADRAARASEGAANRGASEKEAAARLFFDAQRLKQGGEQFDQTLAQRGTEFDVTNTWAQSPLNPQNQASSASADYTRSLLPKDPKELNSTIPDGDLPTLTPAEAKKAKPGTRYKTTDGRIIIR